LSYKARALAPWRDAAFRSPDYVDEDIDDYAEDHSTVGDRSARGDRSITPLRNTKTEVANGNSTNGAVPVNIVKQ
jgi:hypothetical protein